MKIRRSSDYSISCIFDNLEIELHYPLIRLSLTNIAFKLDTEISYYKLNLTDIFTFLLLGFGIVVTKDIQH